MKRKGKRLIWNRLGTVKGSISTPNLLLFPAILQMSKYGLKMLSTCLKRDSITFWSAAEYFTEQVKWVSHTAAIQWGQTHLKTQLYPSVKGNATQRNDGHRKEAVREAKSKSRACQASRWNIFVPPGHWGTGTSHPRQPCGTPSTHPCCWAPVDGWSANAPSTQNQNLSDKELIWFAPKAISYKLFSHSRRKFVFPLQGVNRRILRYCKEYRATCSMGLRASLYPWRLKKKKEREKDDDQTPKLTSPSHHLSFIAMLHIWKF